MEITLEKELNNEKIERVKYVENALSEYFICNHFRTAEAKNAYVRECCYMLEYVGKDLYSVTRQDAEVYKTYMLDHFKPNTIYKKIRILAAVYSFFDDSGICKNPFSGIALPEREITIKKLTEEDQVAILLRRARDNSISDFTILLLAYRLGLSPTAISRIKLSDVVRTEDNRFGINLYSDRKYNCLMPIPEDMEEPFKAYIQHRNMLEAGHDLLFLSRRNKPYTRNSLWRMISRYNTDITFTQLRKLAAVKMVASGVDKKTVKETLGITDKWVYRYIDAVSCLPDSPLDAVASCTY